MARLLDRLVSYVFVALDYAAPQHPRVSQPPAAIPDQQPVPVDNTARVELQTIAEAYGRTRRTTSSAGRLRRRLMELPIGVCEADRHGVIEFIDGGAIEEAGASQSDWIGVDLNDTKYAPYVQAALRGEEVAFVQPTREVAPGEPTSYQLVHYAPRGSLHTGEIDGVMIAWMLTRPDQLLELTDARTRRTDQ